MTVKVQSSSRSRVLHDRLTCYGDWDERRWIPVNQNVRRIRLGSLQQLAGMNQDCWLPEARSKSDRANAGFVPDCHKSACTYRFPLYTVQQFLGFITLLDIVVSFVFIMSDTSCSSFGAYPPTRIL